MVPRIQLRTYKFTQLHLANIDADLETITNWV